MSKSHLEGTREETGNLPAMTGALLEIVTVDSFTTKPEDKRGAKCRGYRWNLSIVEPKEYKGRRCRRETVVGIEGDENAQKRSTWELPGAQAVKRILVRSGTPVSNDDEQWMEAARGNRFVAAITVSETARGTFNNVGMAFRPTDDDAPKIGVAEEGKGGRGAAAAGQTVRKAKGDEDDDEPAPKKAAPDVDDDETEDEPAPKKTKIAAKPAAKPADDDEDDDD